MFPSELLCYPFLKKESRWPSKTSTMLTTASSSAHATPCPFKSTSVSADHANTQDQLCAVHHSTYFANVLKPISIPDCRFRTFEEQERVTDLHTFVKPMYAEALWCHAYRTKLQSKMHLIDDNMHILTSSKTFCRKQYWTGTPPAASRASLTRAASVTAAASLWTSRMCKTSQQS